MNIFDIINRLLPAQAGLEAEKIPWDEPDFSRRMLANHLAQDHDWASRRQSHIDSQVAWLEKRLPKGARVLDLACGPGFYTQALAALGHECVGVDFSPASIEYARLNAEKAGLPIDYVLSDIRLYEPPPAAFDCVMLIFGEFNVFSRADAVKLLALGAGALKSGGFLVVEGHTFEAVKETGLTPPSWWTAEAGKGVLSAESHLCLQENFWDEETSVTTTRYYTLDARTNEVQVFSSSMTGYSLETYEEMLAAAGFEQAWVLSPGDWPVGEPFEGVMITLTAVKK